MTLTEKIELLIRKRQLTPTQFSELIGIPRSNVSHILSGRNKPSLDVVQRILNAFPEIIVESFLFEDRDLAFDSPIKEESKQEIKVNPIEKVETEIGPVSKVESKPQQPGLFDAPIESPRESVKNISMDTNTENEILTPQEDTVQNIPNPAAQSIELPSKVSSHVYKKIERVIIFYSDGTFSESKPSS
ncbi:MAG: hypothetical protein RIR51_2142 [Bacteroidota bacterium]|jgi:transcriptional regulator with XRE-family HTH domain